MFSPILFEKAFILRISLWLSQKRIFSKPKLSINKTNYLNKNKLVFFLRQWQKNKYSYSVNA